MKVKKKKKMTNYRRTLKIGTNTNFSTTSLTNDENLVIGDFSAMDGRAFHGIIDDLSIYSESDYSLSGNLIAHWNFNDGGGSTLTDLSGNGNNGSINGATWSDDVYLPPIPPIPGGDNSLSFSGSNQYVQIGNPFSGNKSDFTISAWIKAIPSNDSYGRPFYVHNAAYADVVGNVQNNPGSETILFRIYEGDGSQANTQIECDFSSHMGEWTYVTLMNESNGSGNNTQKILINGEVKALSLIHI